MGANASRRVNTRASSGDMNLSDGCKGAPIPDGVKLPIMCGEDVMSQKVRMDTSRQHARETLHISSRMKLFQAYTASLVYTLLPGSRHHGGMWLATNTPEIHLRAASQRRRHAVMKTFATPPHVSAVVGLFLL